MGYGKQLGSGWRIYYEIINKMKEKLKIDLSLLSKYRTELMGFSAIGILMCHACGNHVAMPSIIFQICSLGQLGVSIFFLLSGMGMYYSLQKTEQCRRCVWGGN